MYRVFYYDDAKGVQVSADGALEKDTDAICALMDEVLTSVMSFVGVVADDGSMLNFVVLDDDAPDGIQLDVPQPKRRGSYQKMTTLEDCKQILSNAEGQFRHDRVQGLAFEKW